MSDTNNNDDGVVECISINGTIIDLRDVSFPLRAKYHSAARAVGRGDKARDELNRVGQAILNEQVPILAAKAFSEAHKRGRVRGHAAIERLMKVSR
jgi:hypothetical protein